MIELEKMFKFIDFINDCKSVKKEGNVLYLFPINYLNEGRWLTPNELYNFYVKYKDTNEDFKNYLNLLD